jgi:hypothetical protein
MEDLVRSRVDIEVIVNGEWCIASTMRMMVRHCRSLQLHQKAIIFYLKIYIVYIHRSDIKYIVTGTSDYRRGLDW